MSDFVRMQQAYARHGVATYPLGENKVPAITNYQRVGLPGSRELAKKYPDADALGFVAGARNRLTIIDIDSPDDRLVQEVQEQYGATPLQVMTPSGGSHLYYRHGGEKRRIRPIPDVDVLGGGPVVGIGSRVSKGVYRIVRGSLDDLARLAPMATSFYEGTPCARRMAVEQGRRNDELWKHCMRNAPHCDNVEALLDVARTFNEDLMTPLADSEVVKTAKSAWGCEQRGENRFGRGPGAWVPAAEQQAIVAAAGTDVLALLTILRSLNEPDAEFWIANGFTQYLGGWTLRRLQIARRALIALGYIKQVRTPRQGANALYAWTGRRRIQRKAS